MAGPTVIAFNNLESPLTAIIHPSTHRGERGMWQLSWLDESGEAVEHMTFEKREDALRHLAQQGGWFVTGER